MKHLLATGSLHDGGGLFTFAWSVVVIPLSLALVFNYRGTAERMAERMAQQMTARMTRRMLQRGWSPPIDSVTLRVYGGVFLAFGLIALGLALGRFAEGGY